MHCLTRFSFFSLILWPGCELARVKPLPKEIQREFDLHNHAEDEKKETASSKASFVREHQGVQAKSEPLVTSIDRVSLSSRPNTRLSTASQASTTSADRAHLFFRGIEEICFCMIFVALFQWFVATYIGLCFGVWFFIRSTSQDACSAFLQTFVGGAVIAFVLAFPVIFLPCICLYAVYTFMPSIILPESFFERSWIRFLEKIGFAKETEEYHKSVRQLMPYNFWPWWSDFIFNFGQKAGRQSRPPGCGRKGGPSAKSNPPGTKRPFCQEYQLGMCPGCDERCIKMDAGTKKCFLHICSTCLKSHPMPRGDMCNSLKT
eukprot:TRINITY_DN63618_c0_g1_i1.p1 TRINITY_DN63618_c0_g1~~TRINITY_DN63618_c0_g1_i1.p1  ORF type:complete len:318 (+),score=12.87 TRINITY_DN63618_c0_g1_i1:42-995(+)